MKVFDTAVDMFAFSSSLRNSGKRIALVPTMGALHRGHLSLIERASELSDAVVVSIYVNPTQFAPGEDFGSYPRTLESDLQKCRDLGVEAVFTPSDATMYAPDHSTYVEEIKLSTLLCGRTRPSHFRGVTTIVLKLFNITVPDIAVFGRKDAQQARIIMRMVCDLNVPVNIELAPTVREKDGLAMSSRNAYLSADERKSAALLYASLLKAKELIESGVISPAQIHTAMTDVLSGASPAIDLDYIEILSDPDLEERTEINGAIIIAIAARIGKTRLIDNIELNAG